MPHIHKIILEKKSYAVVTVDEALLSELEGRTDENIAGYLDRINPTNVEWGRGVAKKVAQVDEWYDEKYAKVECPKCHQTVVPTHYTHYTHYKLCPYCHTNLEKEMCVRIQIEGGVCTEVDGLPDGWQYQVDNKD